MDKKYDNNSPIMLMNDKSISLSNAYTIPLHILAT